MGSKRDDLRGAPDDLNVVADRPARQSTAERRDPTHKAVRRIGFVFAHEPKAALRAVVREAHAHVHTEAHDVGHRCGARHDTNRGAPLRPVTQIAVDVDRVEILRGPQGTMFGRDSTGGALRIWTKRPGDEFGGNIAATVGSNERRDVKASLGLSATRSSPSGRLRA